LGADNLKRKKEEVFVAQGSLFNPAAFGRLNTNRNVKKRTLRYKLSKREEGRSKKQGPSGLKGAGERTPYFFPLVS
jgi:hypothetical protein